MNRTPDQDHLEELLDAALAGTFPASDPVSGLVHERTKPPSANVPPDNGPARDPEQLRTPRA